MSKKSFNVKVALKYQSYKAGIKYSRTTKKDAIARKAEAEAIKKVSEIWKSQTVSAKISRSVAKGLNEFEIEHPPIIKEDPVKRGLDTAQWVARTSTLNHENPVYGSILNIQLMNKQKPYPYTIFVDNSNGVKVYRGVIANQAAVRLAPKKLTWIKSNKGRWSYSYPDNTPKNNMDMDRLTSEPRMHILGTRINDPRRIKYMVLRFHKKGKTYYRTSARYARDTDWYRDHIIETTGKQVKNIIMELGS